MLSITTRGKKISRRVNPAELAVSHFPATTSTAFGVSRSSGDGGTHSSPSNHPATSVRFGCVAMGESRTRTPWSGPFRRTSTSRTATASSASPSAGGSTVTGVVALPASRCRMRTTGGWTAGGLRASDPPVVGEREQEDHRDDAERVDDQRLLTPREVARMEPCRAVHALNVLHLPDDQMAGRSRSDTPPNGGAEARVIRGCGRSTTRRRTR